MAAQRGIIVSILADAAGMHRGTAEARKQLRQFERDVKQTQKQLAAVAKAATVAGAALAAGLAYGLKKSVDAALEAEKAQASLQAQLSASGIAYSKYRDQIDQTLQAQSRLSAFDDEDLSASFTRLVRSTGDVEQALRLNALAADVARGRNIELDAAAQLVTKAAMGQGGALRRLGIDAEKGASATELLTSLQQKFSGQAEAFGKTAAGSMARVKVEIENAQEVLGGALLPAIQRVTAALSAGLAKPEVQAAIKRIADRLGDAADRLVAFGAANKDTVIAFAKGAVEAGKKAVTLALAVGKVIDATIGAKAAVGLFLAAFALSKFAAAFRVLGALVLGFSSVTTAAVAAKKAVVALAAAMKRNPILLAVAAAIGVGVWAATRGKGEMVTTSGTEGVLRRRQGLAARMAAEGIVAPGEGRNLGRVVAPVADPLAGLGLGGFEGIGGGGGGGSVAKAKAFTTTIGTQFAGRLHPAALTKDAERLHAQLRGVEGQLRALGSTASVPFNASLEKMVASAKRLLERTQQIRSAFTSAFGAVSSRALDQFDRAASKKLAAFASTAAAALDRLDAERAQETGSERELRLLLANREQAQRDEAIKAAKSDLEKARAEGDAAAIAQAVKALDDAELEQRLADLRASATQERSARDAEYAKRRSVLEQQQAEERQRIEDQLAYEKLKFGERLTALQTSLLAGKTSIASFTKELAALFVEFGLDPAIATAGDLLADYAIRPLIEAIEDAKSKYLSLIEVLAGGKIPLNASTASGLPGGLLAGVGGIRSPRDLLRLADGGIVTRPTVALIGEAGPEAVVPLGRGRGRGVTVVLNNPVLLGRSPDVARDLARMLKPELDRQLAIA